MDSMKTSVSILILLFFSWSGISCSSIVPPQKPQRGTRKPLQGEVTILISTTKGEMIGKIYPEKAPEGAKIFLDLVKKGFYNGKKFIRVVKKPFPFLIQTGAPQNNPHLSAFKPKIIPPGNFHHIRGAIALAKDPLSGGVTSQFYILLTDAPYLDGKDTVIGEIIDGMEVAKKIGKEDLVKFIKILKRGENERR